MTGETPTAAVPDVVEESSWQDHPVAITVAALGGALILAGILAAAGAFAGDTGDEPPIRVKNGSLELHLLTNNKHWKERGNGDVKRWKISGGTRGDDTLDVDITVNAGATCNYQSASGNAVTMYYDNGTKVSVHSNSRHAWVDSDADLTLTNNKRQLSYQVDGFISRVTLDGKDMCTFTSKTQLANLVISDF